MRKKQAKWTEEQTRILCQRYARLGIRGMQVLLPDKTRRQIKEKAKSLRLRRNPAILKRERARLLRSIASLGGKAIVQKYGLEHLRKIAKKGASGRQQAREKGNGYFTKIARMRWQKEKQPPQQGFSPLPLHMQIRRPKPLPDWWNDWSTIL